MPAAIEKLSSPTSDGETPVSRPTRRSAAVASKNAWQALMPHKKGALSGGEEEDAEDYYTPERQTPKERGRKRSTPATQQTGVKKRIRTPRTAKAAAMNEVSDDDEPRPPAVVMPVSARKVLAPQQQGKSAAQTPAAPTSQKSMSTSALMTIKKVDASPTRQQSQKVSPQKMMEALQADVTATATVTASNQPLIIRPKASILGKRAPVLSPKPAAAGDADSTPTVTANSQRAHQQMLLKSGAGAMTKEELEEIEREVQKHGLDDPSGGDAGDGSHESEDGDEYPACPPKPRPSLNARSGRGVATVNSAPRASTRGGTTVGSGPRGRGARGGRGGVSRRGARGGGANTTNGNTTEISEFKTAGSVVGPAIMRNPARQSIAGPSGTVKVLRIRPSIPNGGVHRGASNFPSYMMPSSSGGGSGMSMLPPSRPSAALGPFAPMYANLSREVNEYAQRYADRVVPGTTVQEFSSIVDDLSQELNRVIDEKMRLRDYMEQMAATREAEIDLKDKKIQDLEYTIEILQSKLAVSYKRIHLNALKHESGPGERKKATVEAADGSKSTDKSGDVVANETESDTPAKLSTEADSVAPRPMARVYAPLQQKFASRGPLNAQGSRINAFRFYEADEDNDVDGMDDAEDSGENGKSSGRGAVGGMIVSGPGGGSIFKQASGRSNLPMPLNSMNGRRVFMRGYSGGRAYPPPNAPRRFNDSEEGLVDEEDDELDEMEEEDELTLTNEERRNLANLASRNGRMSMKRAGSGDNDPNDGASAGEDQESMVIGAEELVDGGEVGANQTVL